MAGGKYDIDIFEQVSFDVEDAAKEKLDVMTGAFKAKLSECMESGDDGRIHMTITLPSEAYLDTMAKSLARMVAGREAMA